MLLNGDSDCLMNQGTLALSRNYLFVPFPVQPSQPEMESLTLATCSTMNHR